MTKEQIKEEAIKAGSEQRPRCAKDSAYFGVYSSYCIGFIDGAEFVNKELDNELELYSFNFWKRLQMFVSDVQVNDMMGEEEKQMILSTCKKHIKK